ncbi:hypothetical protein GTU71_12970 [Rathayibacter sp. VKM Ac-2762]|uniref:DUF6602 domain-containing protein n=1 Tax=Rathayibacter sp. VKM Ac-2762 TaxID=2609254 RepID=UPI00132EF513|nr:DUF6602 domain-containing protein [Rathayibacter sp. VKM Ac-2762]QHF21653.1 hypothetical protein GTU71_12970 [Rathayibacter sp. VKM Ac-2762]
MVEEYWTGVASQLQIEADVFSRLVGHNGETGRANEIALESLVTKLIPAHYGVGTGIVIDRHGGRSKQCDLIVFDKASQPQLLAQSTQLLFPIETVRMVIEVKTTVTAKEIADSSEKKLSLNALDSASERTPAFGLFGYQSHGAPSVRALEINELPENSRPDLTCLLVPGVVTDPGNLQVVGMVPLHKVTAAGERLSEQWIAATGTATWIASGVTRYPISRFKPNGPRHVFEPGRALLIFAKLLLDVLNLDAGAEASWLGNYLPPIARQIVVPSR